MDVTLYEVLLFAHITAVAVWVGGDAMIQVFALRAMAAGPQRTADLMRDVEWIGTRVLVPFSLLVVATGVWMVLDFAAWEFSQFWVSAGLGVFALSFITGAAFLGPESGRLGVLTDEKGAEDPEVALIAVIWIMVTKPGL